VKRCSAWQKAKNDAPKPASPAASGASRRRTSPDHAIAPLSQAVLAPTTRPSAASGGEAQALRRRP
jgi:hypothetical protein